MGELMVFEVEIHPRVSKAVNKLPKAHYSKFCELLEILKIKAVPAEIFDVVKLKGTGKLDLYRIRFGDFRVIYVVDWENGVIKIHRLERRGKAYK